MIQLWVNLPKKDKMASPRYQGLKSESIPQVALPHEAGSVRVIAGEFSGQQGPAKTFTPINLWDMRLHAGAKSTFTVPAGHTTSIFVLSGKISVGGKTISAAEVGVLETQGEVFELQALEETKALFLGGEPIAEPIAGYGPFMMNDFAEIHKAFQDYQEGRMGKLPS